MKTLWFSFGQVHEHVIQGKVFNKDCIVEITHEDPREVMCSVFGQKWSMEYAQKPDMDLYPRGIKKLEFKVLF